MQDGVRRQLLSGEQILWEGRPSTGLILRPMEAFLIPFSLLWGGFALFWNISVWATDADLAFRLFGLPFVVGAVYITVGRFWLDMYLRRRLLHLVTDRRILILKQGNGTTSKSLDIKRLPSLDLEERPDGGGTIRFGAAASLFNSSNFGVWQPSFDPTLSSSAFPMSARFTN